MSNKPDRFKPKPQYTTIAGLSQQLRMPRQGKIRLGVKVRKADLDSRCRHDIEASCFYCTYPRDVDYFVCPPEVRAVYGDKPKELDILIPSERMDLVFPQALKCYKGSRLWCKGDGQTATRIDMATGSMFSIECPCEHYHAESGSGLDPCHERANLMVLLPRVSMSGAYQIDTGSVSNIIELNSSIEYIRSSLLGRIAFVPLKLRREPTQIQYTDKRGVRTTTKALLKLEIVGDIQKIAQLRQRDIISIEGGIPAQVRGALPPAPVEDGVDTSPGDVLVDEDLSEPDAPETPEGAGEEISPPDDAQTDAGPEGEIASQGSNMGDNVSQEEGLPFGKTPLAGGKAPERKPKEPKTDDEKRTFILEVANRANGKWDIPVSTVIKDLSKFVSTSSGSEGEEVFVTDVKKLSGRWLNKTYASAKKMNDSMK